MDAVPSPQREQRRRRKAWVRAAWAVGLTCVFHGLLFLWLALLASLSPAPARGPAQPLQAVALRSVSAEEWERSRQIGATSSAPSAPLEEKKPEREEVDGQVVDVAPGNRKESEDARFLAPTANRVEKETRARETTAFYRNAMPQMTSPRPSPAEPPVPPPPEPQDTPGQDVRPDLGGGAGRQRLAMEVPSSRRVNELELKPTEDGEGAAPTVANRQETVDVQGNSDRLRVVPGAPDGDTDQLSLAGKGKIGLLPGGGLLPPPGAVGPIAGAAANDHLDDVEEGDGTFLNTKEWKYSSFFNRVKQSVGMQWRPIDVLRPRDPTGNIYGGRDRYTLLSVTLDDRGRIKDISVEKSCGLDFLDTEAIQSFQRAQPFPNPPAGLLAADSTVRFSFGFFLEGGPPRLRLFRQLN
jgi:TonB family protein